VLADLGMMALDDSGAKVKSKAYNVLVDGKVVGFVGEIDAARCRFDESVSPVIY
jgi:hypothetical protein